MVRIVEEAAWSMWASPEDPKALTQAIQDLSKQPNPRERLGANGRKYVCEHFDRKTVTGRYRQLLHQGALDTR